MFDTIRRMIIAKFDLRRKIGEKMQGIIISKIIKTLNARMKEIKNHEVLPCGDLTAKVTVSLVRYAVNLENKTCSCKAWQVSGKLCSHALVFIATLLREVNMEEFVHEYFSIERFKKAYTGNFKAISSKHQWQRVTLGYKIRKPKLRRKPGRPKVARIRASDEVGTSKKRTCTECNESGHTAKYCQGGLTSSKKRRMSKDDGPSGENVMKARFYNAEQGNRNESLTKGRPRGVYRFTCFAFVLRSLPILPSLLGPTNAASRSPLPPPHRRRGPRRGIAEGSCCASSLLSHPVTFTAAVQERDPRRGPPTLRPAHGHLPLYRHLLLARHQRKPHRRPGRTLLRPLRVPHLLRAPRHRGAPLRLPLRPLGRPGPPLPRLVQRHPRQGRPAPAPAICISRHRVDHAQAPRRRLPVPPRLRGLQEVPSLVRSRRRCPMAPGLHCPILGDGKSMILRQLT